MLTKCGRLSHHVSLNIFNVRVWGPATELTYLPDPSVVVDVSGGSRRARLKADPVGWGESDQREDQPQHRREASCTR